jgi:ABC-2 type transport system permease protein
MFASNFTLCKFILRRDWLQTVLWFAGIFALTVGFGAAIPDMYPDQESLGAMVETLKSPAMVAMIGPAYTDSSGVLTLGAMYSVFMLVWSAIIVGVMNIFFVVRHTRRDEEYGRIEVIRSLPVGRLSNLSATLTTAVILNVSLALFVGLGLGIVGERNMDYAGGLLFGAAICSFGLVMASITAIFCQLNKNPNTATAVSIGFLTLLYFLSAVGHMQESKPLAAVSLLGFIMKAKVYVDNNWMPVIIVLMVALVSTAIAFYLCSIRDMGEGLIPSRPGKSDAAPYLKNAGGLAWRLLRTPFIVWVLVIPILGIAYGSIMGDLESFINTNEIFMQISGGDPMRMASFFLLVMSLCSAIPVLQFILKVRGQEKRGYAENILARSVSRHSQLRGYFIIALITAVIMPVLNAAGFWAGSTPVMDHPVSFGKWFLGCVVYIPALLVMIGVAMILIAYLSRYTGLAWGYLGFSFAVLYLGRLVNLPEWIGKLSPFGHIPMIPKVERIGELATYNINTSEMTAMLVMTVLAAIMFVLGFIGYRNRDMKFN